MNELLKTILLSDESINFPIKNKDYTAFNSISFCYQISSLFSREEKNIAIITSSLYSAQTLYEQLSDIIGEEHCLLFPVDEIFHQTNYAYSKEMLAQRLFVMDKCLSSTKKILITHYASSRRYFGQNDS